MENQIPNQSNPNQQNQQENIINNSVYSTKQIKKNNKFTKTKLVSIFLITGIIGIFIVTGAFAAFTMYNRSQASETKLATNNANAGEAKDQNSSNGISDSKTISTEGWKTFTDVTNGLSIKYPNDLFTHCISGTCFIGAKELDFEDGGSPLFLLYYYKKGLLSQEPDYTKLYNLNVGEKYTENNENTTIERVKDTKIDNINTKTYIVKNSISSSDQASKIFIGSTLKYDFLIKSLNQSQQLNNQIISKIEILNTNEQNDYLNLAKTSFGSDFSNAQIIIYNEYFAINPGKENLNYIFAKQENKSLKKLIEFPTNKEGAYTCMDFVKSQNEAPKELESLCLWLDISSRDSTSEDTFEQSNDSKRKSNITQILNAIGAYSADNRGLIPAGIPTGKAAEIGDGQGQANICAAIVPNYIPALPSDPTVNSGTEITSCKNYKTGYFIVKDSANKITVSAPTSDSKEKITITR